VGNAVVPDGILGASIMNGHFLELDLNNPLLVFPGDPFQSGTATFNRSTGAFSISGLNAADTISASTDGTTGSYKFDRTGTVIETGTFAIAAVPEPASVLLLLTILIFVTSVLKRRLHLSKHPRKNYFTFKGAIV
jgi:hypothetical protein